MSIKGWFERRYVGAFAVGMLWGIVIVLVAGTLYIRSSIVKEYRSSYNFE